MLFVFHRALGAAALLTLAGGIGAQDEPKTHLVVKVNDHAGGPIRHAEVRIGRATDSIYPILLTDANGELVADLRPGNYDLEVRSSGFKSYKKPLIVQQSGGELSITVALAVGSCPPGPCISIQVKVVSAPGPEIPLSSPSSNIPTECSGQVDHETGVPFFFPAEKGMRFGVSLKTTHLSESSQVPLYFWIDNETNKAVDLDACSLFQDKAIDVWSRSSRRLLKRRDFEAQSSRSCFADIKISVPAHSCTVASKLYLNEIYSLVPDVYTVIKSVGGKSPSPEKKGPDGLTFQLRREARCRQLADFPEITSGIHGKFASKAEFPCGPPEIFH